MGALRSELVGAFSGGTGPERTAEIVVLEDGRGVHADERLGNMPRSDLLKGKGMWRAIV